MGRAGTNEECARARPPARVCVSERVGVYPEIKQMGVGREGVGGPCARGRCGRILARGRASKLGRRGELHV